jgi:hypothetical protein
MIKMGLRGRRHPIFSIIARACAFLVLGAIINVAVAWGSSLWVRFDDARWQEFGTNLADRAAGDFFAREFMFVGRSHQIGGFRIYTSFPTTIANQIPPTTAAQVAREWMPFILSTRPAKDQRHLQFIDARGLPWPSMYCTIYRQWSIGQRTSSFDADHTAIILRNATGNPPGKWNGVVLPCMPLWSGFGLNTLVYAVVLWGFFAAPFALRRRMRIRRGLCPACAYPVGESEMCTECGAQLPSHSR